jgi:RNase HI (EC 3.1.26.4)
MKQVTIYTDGACSGNPGPGGWGAVLLYGEHCKEISGACPETTNQRMELKAVIEGLKALKVRGWEVLVHTDSAYLVNAFAQGWLDKWQKKRLEEQPQRRSSQPGSVAGIIGTGFPEPD